MEKMIWRIFVLGWRVTHPPKLPCVIHLFIYFLTKCEKSFTWETKSWLGYKGDLSSRVTLLWWQGHPCIQANFSPYKHFGFRQSEHAWAILNREKASTIFSYKHLLKLTWLGGSTFYSEKIFFIHDMYNIPQLIVWCPLELLKQVPDIVE